MKRPRSPSTPTNQSPVKKRSGRVNQIPEVIEIFDSDEEPSTEPASGTATSRVRREGAESQITPKALKISPEGRHGGYGGEEVRGSLGEFVKDKDGKYVITNKVKVDRIECLVEVPKQWPVPPEGNKVAYVIDFKDDKKIPGEG